MQGELSESLLIPRRIGVEWCVSFLSRGASEEWYARRAQRVRNCALIPLWPRQNKPPGSRHAFQVDRPVPQAFPIGNGSQPFHL